MKIKNAARNPLKILRITAMTLTVSVFTVIFLHAEPFSGWTAPLFTTFQAWPAVSLALSSAAVLAITAVIIIALVTLLFGRVFCSMLCPLGGLQDIFHSAGRKAGIKTRFSKPLHFLRYGILAALVILFTAGNGALLLLLEPYSHYGRITANLIKPAFLAGNNLAAGLLESMKIYVLHKNVLHSLSAILVIFSAVSLLLLAVSSFFKGRLFCNTLCPVGSLLGIFSRFSLFGISINNSCTECGLCASNCRAGCIDVKNRSVDKSRCVACFDCLSSCRFEALHYSAALPALSMHLPARREFIKNTVLMTAAFIPAAAAAAGFRLSKPDSNLCLPPGAESALHLQKYCTACHLCVSVCPTRVIAPAMGETGLSMLFLPRLDFKKGYCTYECTSCMQACPTGALKDLTLPRKKETRLGISRFIAHLCIVTIHETDCGACSEHCPTKAVIMVPYKGNLRIPLVRPDICIGCGACEHVCPSRAGKAIVVDGLSIHDRALPPESAPREPDRVEDRVEIKKSGEEFPF